VTTVNILNEGMPGDDGPGADIGLQAAHHGQDELPLTRRWPIYGTPHPSAAWI
jgi:hypothetical protein